MPQAVADQPAHSIVGASAAHCWSRCPGSVQHKLLFHRRHPGWDTGSEASREGTEAHELCETLLLNPELPLEGDEIDSWHDQSMLGHALAYRDYCTIHTSADAKTWVEARLFMPSIHAAAFGTGDFVTYSPLEKHLHIIDLKYGQGVRVAAKNNEQLIMYAEGARLMVEGKTGTRVKQITMHIYQPRVPNGVTSWTITPRQLATHVDRLATAARETNNPDAAFNPGHKACRWCEAKPDCATYADWLWSQFSDDLPDLEQMMATLDDKPNVVSNEDIADWMKRFEGVSVYARVLQQVARHRAMMGEHIPGKKLVAGQTRYRADAESVEFVLGDVAMKPAELRSRTELLKVLGKKRFEATVGEFFSRDQGAPSLVDEGDDRPALQQLGVEDDFEDLD